MIARAIARFIRVSPRKTRYVLNVIRGKNVEQAFALLASVNKGSAFYITQVLKSALNNAVKKTNGAVDASNLFICKATADGGPTLKRHKAGSMGRAMPIRKRMSHICIEVDAIKKVAHDLEHAGHKKEKKEKQEQPVKSAEKNTKKKEVKKSLAAKAK